MNKNKLKMKYKVTLISKDNQKFTAQFDVPNEQQAVEKTFECIKNLKWDSFDYKLDKVVSV